MGSGTQLGQVRGLGSSGHGADHWVKQRTTAVYNFALMIWLITALTRLPDYSFSTVVLWLSQPIVAVPMMLLILSVFTHFRMGLQIVIEDYVHDSGLKFAALTALNIYTIGCGALGIFAVAKIALTVTTGAPQQ